MGWDPARDSPDGSILSPQLTAPGEGVCLSRPLPGEQGAGAGGSCVGPGRSVGEHPGTVILCSPKPSPFAAPDHPSPFAIPNYRPSQPETTALRSPTASPFRSPKLSPLAAPDHRPLQPQTIALCSPIASPFAAPLPPYRPAPLCLGDRVCRTTGAAGRLPRRAGRHPWAPRAPAHLARDFFLARSYPAPLGNGASLGKPNQFGEARPCTHKPGELGRWQGRDPQPGAPLAVPAGPCRGEMPGERGRDARGPGCLPHRPNRSRDARGRPIPPRRGFGRLLHPKGQPLALGLASPSSPPSPLAFFLFFKPKLGSAVALSTALPSCLWLRPRPPLGSSGCPLPPSSPALLFALVPAPESPSLPHSTPPWGWGRAGCRAPNPLPKRVAKGRAALGPRFSSHPRAAWRWWG